MRKDHRRNDQLREVRITRNVTDAPAGSVLIQQGSTQVICTASVESSVPDFLEGKGSGWLTAEYGMLPGSTSPRKQRPVRAPDGRTYEIQRLVGRAMRAVTELAALPGYSIWIDCDVLRADGGTRTAAITGAYVALFDAFRFMERQKIITRWPLLAKVAAVSVGICGGEILLDLDYSEDSSAQVDMNVVMTDKGEFVEVQGTAELSPFSQDQLLQMLTMARDGIVRLFAAQESALAQS